MSKQQPNPSLHHRPRKGEEGYVLLMVIFLVALVTLSLAVAAPKWKKDIQRDQEQELMHRGMQYAHAVKLYYRIYGSYPTSVKQLLNTNNVRFLRQEYADPITGKKDWRLVQMLQAGFAGSGGQITGATAAGAVGSSGSFGGSGSTSFGGGSASGGSMFGGGSSSPGGPHHGRRGNPGLARN
jgi:type II secretory pathway pseudopilin PulG